MSGSRSTHRRSGAVAMAIVVAVGSVALAGPSSAATGCEQYSALGSAAGVRAFHTAPGLLLTDADGNMPGAQAEADSLTGSRGWAGAPYSAVAAENGARATDPNQVPLIAVSSYPTTPEAGRSTAAATIQSTSAPRRSAARAEASLPTSDQLGAGRSSTSAEATCADDGAVRAVADSAVDMIDVVGVLRIGSVRSHAVAEVDADGKRKLDGTMVIEGATVLGLPAAITDQGVVVGSSVVPSPEDPVAKALTDAKITVRKIAAVKDAERGEVQAPGLEITVNRGIEGVGSGTATTTFVFGRTLARAAATASTAAAVDVLAGPSDGGVTGSAGEVASVAGPVGPASEQAVEPQAVGATAATAAVGTAETASPVRPAVRTGTALPATAMLADTSSAGPYAAVATGAFVLLAAWMLFGRLGSRIRWR